MTHYNIGYLIGSLATASINRKLATALVKLAPPTLRFREIPFKDLPLYSYDYDADYPPPARALKAAIEAADAVLFVTPEYNRSIPGGLKNAIDWASRPYGTNSFAHKPSAVIGTSPGAIGTAVAQQSLRSVLSFCNSPQMNAPEAYIQFTPGLITDDGQPKSDSSTDSLTCAGDQCDFSVDAHGVSLLLRSTVDPHAPPPSHHSPSLRTAHHNIGGAAQGARQGNSGASMLDGFGERSRTQCRATARRFLATRQAMTGPDRVRHTLFLPSLARTLRS